MALRREGGRRRGDAGGGRIADRRSLLAGLLRTPTARCPWTSFALPAAAPLAACVTLVPPLLPATGRLAAVAPVHPGPGPAGGGLSAMRGRRRSTFENPKDESVCRTRRPRAVVQGRPAVHLHPVRQVLHRGAGVRLGDGRRGARPWRSSSASRSASSGPSTPARPAAGGRSRRRPTATACSTTGEGLHRLPGPPGPVPDVAVLGEQPDVTARRGSGPKAICPGSGQGELIPVEEIVRRVKVIKM